MLNILFYLLVWAAPSFAQNKAKIDDLYHFAQNHETDLRLSVYITVGAVKNALDDADGRREAVSVLRSLGITKAYIETYRGGRSADVRQLQQLRDYLNANGFATAGGIATTPGKNVGVKQEGRLGWFNFQHAKTRTDLENIARMTAKIFDQIIIDDFLCTADTGRMSVRARGGQSWAQYRMNLMTGVTKRVFIDPIKTENPAAFVIIKFPQWYDRFHLFGYDVVREPKLFDQVWIGTESRGPDTRRMGFVPQYEGFVNFRWLSSFAPGKVGGAWFDHIDCNAYDFIDQANQAVLAGAREIILFNYFNLMNGHSGHHLLRRQFSRLVKLAKMVHKKPLRGIYAYKPPYSDAGSDHYIFDFLGMIGLPLLPVGQFPAAADVLFLPTQAAADTQITAQVEQLLSRGKTIIITPGFLQAVPEKNRMLKLAGIKMSFLRTPVKIKLSSSETELKLPAVIKPVDASVLLSVQSDGRQLPFLTQHRLDSGGSVFLLNICTFSERDFKAVHEVLLSPAPVPWLDLPETWLDEIRKSLSAPLGFYLLAPGRISLHPYGEDQWVICNFNDQPVEVDLVLKKSLAPNKNSVFINGSTGEKIIPSGNQIHLSIGRRQLFWLKQSVSGL